MPLEDSLLQRIAGIEDHLALQQTDVKNEQAHLTLGSRESAYWHYGYMMALKDLLRQQSTGQEIH